jgi:hypothetical protein
MAGHEDDRHLVAESFQMKLEVQAIGAGQPYVEQYAAGPLKIGIGQEILSAFEGLRFRSHRQEEIDKRLSDRWIVIHDVNDGRIVARGFGEFSGIIHWIASIGTIISNTAPPSM